ncbi:MAG: DUF4301 family protein [Bacteroidales bacterium]|nr:DUF4301 family protein [Bacteroidales bacterium]
MKNNNFTSDDLKQIAALGVSPEQVQRQIENFHSGFPKMELLEAATVANGGILKLQDHEITHFTNSYKRLAKGKRIQKFVPASGAATRMFKALYEFSSKYFGMDYSVEKDFPEVKEFIEHIRSFAFFEDLTHTMEKAGLDFGDSMDRADFATIINILLMEQYMGYGSLPKALLKFHRYGNASRTALEEHIVEGIEYAQCDNDTVNLHFTVSPEHHKLFWKKIMEVKRYYESTFNVKLNITLSEQRHYTDIIAVDEYNTPLRDEKGRLVFRPGGHGALIENLNDLKADLVFVKNVDNVVPDWMKHTTVVYKKALAGMLLELQEQTFNYLSLLDKNADEKQVAEVANFAINRLNITLPDVFATKTTKEKSRMLKNLLNRPMRVCGMVRNQGEPGGGPFFVRDSQGFRSLQIVETAQINRKRPEQEAILASSTHFNPVDLVCATKNYRGRRFNLRTYVDPTTGFISKKSKGATTLKSQELPGLWNGSMARWITLFVEVPLATFNPVKTVNDLLRKEHLES